MEAISKLSITRKAMLLERLLQHGRVDKRAAKLIQAYMANPKEEFTQEECDHLVWVLGHLIDADDADEDAIMASLIMLRYCIFDCSQEMRDKFLHKVVLEEL
jgi:hypothetical protein